MTERGTAGECLHVPGVFSLHPQMFGSVVFPALHPVPLLKNDNWPNRHFLGEAGTKAPASTQSEPEQYT